MEQQDPENRALLRVTELDNLALAEHLERPQDVELHHTSFTAVKAGFLVQSHHGSTRVLLVLYPRGRVFRP